MKYNQLAKPYKPKDIRVLLIGEAPPSNGNRYFYKIPETYKPVGNVADDSSLTATIFNHYFVRRPNDPAEYEQFLKCLKERGVFLIDIINENLEIKKRGQPFNKENIKKLVSPENLSDLKRRIKKLTRSDTKIIFLLPTGRPYVKKLREVFLDVSFVNWKCFRLDIHEAEECERKPAHNRK
ncbi:MAG: hypothetical protein LC105_04095 [Chitinophagales bacterium]|nr:hypothetical protein [Chitinophagales bacterium]